MEPSKKRKGKEIEESGGRRQRSRSQDQTPSSTGDGDHHQHQASELSLIVQPPQFQALALAHHHQPSVPINDPSLITLSAVTKVPQASSNTTTAVSSKSPLIHMEYPPTRQRVRSKDEFKELAQKLTGHAQGQLANNAKPQTTTHQGNSQSPLLIQSSSAPLTCNQPQQSSTLHSFPIPHAQLNQIFNAFPRQSLPVPPPALSCLPPLQFHPANGNFCNILPPPFLSFNKAMEIIRAFVKRVGEDHFNLKEKSLLALERDLCLPPWASLFEMYRLYNNSLQVIIHNLITYFQSSQIFPPPVQSSTSLWRDQPGQSSGNLHSSRMPPAQVNEIIYNMYPVPPPAPFCLPPLQVLPDPPAAAVEEGLFDLLPPPHLSLYNAMKIIHAFVDRVGEDDSSLNEDSFLALERDLLLPPWTCLFEIYQQSHNSLHEVILA